MSTRDHWESVYASRATDAVSWFQPRAERSLAFIQATGVPRSAAIIDVGGGASTLVDDLVDRDYTGVTVLDLAGTALAAARARLGPRAARVRWLEADVTRVEFAEGAFDLWHDRAVFHFLTEADQRAAYVAAVLRALRPGGHLIVATFAQDGPVQCSGLPVVRYSADSLQAAFGRQFALRRHEREEHRTPAGAVQAFVYCGFQREAQAQAPRAAGHPA